MLKHIITMALAALISIGSVAQDVTTADFLYINGMQSNKDTLVFYTNEDIGVSGCADIRTILAPPSPDGEILQQNLVMQAAALGSPVKLIGRCYTRPSDNRKFFYMNSILVSTAHTYRR